MSRALVVVQIAVCLAVVFAAGLLAQTLRTLATVDLGFEPDRVIALRVDPAASGRSGAAVSAVFDEMLVRARELPGVAAASLAATPPYGAMAVTMGIDVPGYVPAPGRGDTVVGFNFVSPRYFETLGQDLIRGRDFDERDERGRPLAAIVNERFVDHYFDGRDPLGRRLRRGAEELEILPSLVFCNHATPLRHQEPIRSKPRATGREPAPAGMRLDPGVGRRAIRGKATYRMGATRSGGGRPGRRGRV